MNIRKFLSMGILIALLAGGFVLAFPQGTVAAQAPTPTPSTTPDPSAQKGARLAERLEKLFAAEKNRFDKQGENLDKAAPLIAKAQDLIARAKADGKDTSGLEAALAKFQTKLTDAKTAHNAISGLISGHAGFDANGKVTDPIAAKGTVSSIQGQLKDVRQIVASGLNGVRKAIREFRQANKPTNP